LRYKEITLREATSSEEVVDVRVDHGSIEGRYETMKATRTVDEKRTVTSEDHVTLFCSSTTGVVNNHIG
jgi:hypothetical protein